MKKLLLFAVIAVFGLNSNAQDSGDIELGAGIGYNLSTYYGNDAATANSEALSGIQGGITGEYYLNDTWGIKTGFIFDAKGSSFNGGGEINANYLVIPVYAGFHFGGNKNWYANLGPHIDILMSAKNQAGTDIKSLLSSTDVGLGVGLGYKFEVSDAIKIYIEYQGATGFLEIDDAGSLDYRNTRSAFNVGAVFGL